MAEGEAPLLVLTARAGNNGSIRLLWRGCQASKHFLLVGTARGMWDPLLACPEAGREDTAGAARRMANGPSRNQEGCWGCPCPQHPVPRAGCSGHGPKYWCCGIKGRLGLHQGKAERCRRGRGRSLGCKDKDPRPQGGNKAAGRARMLTQSSCTRLEQPQ